MISLLQFPRQAGLAVILLLLGVSTGQAGSIGFRNDYNFPILVQGASVENNVLRRGQPLLIPPGKMAWDLNLKPGVRIITVYDATQPTRVLYNNPIPFRGPDLLFRVVPMPGNRWQALLLPLMPP